VYLTDESPLQFSAHIVLRSHAPNVMRMHVRCRRSGLAELFRWSSIDHVTVCALAATGLAVADVHIICERATTAALFSEHSPPCVCAVHVFGSCRESGKMVSRPNNIDRVVLVFAAFMITLGTLLGMLVHEGCFAITFFVAANMLQAAFSEFCLLAYILRHAFGLEPGAAFYRLEVADPGLPGASTKDAVAAKNADAASSKV
jgi:hypothetical protein